MLFGIGRPGALWLLAEGATAALFLYIAIAAWHGSAWAGRRGTFNKLAAKGSAELLDLAIQADRSPTGVSGLAGLVYSPPLSSRSGTPPPSGHNVWWATNPGILQPGAVEALADGGSAARPRCQSWAALGSAGSAAGSAGSGMAVVHREASYSSNLNRLGRTRTFSRRSLATASPEGGD